MCRSRWKVPFVSSIFFSKKFDNVMFFNTRIRNSIITDFFIDKKFRVYNGSKSKSFVIRSYMVGKKLGEFSITKILGSDIALSKVLKAKAKKKKKK